MPIKPFLDHLHEAYQHNAAMKDHLQDTETAFFQHVKQPHEIAQEHGELRQLHKDAVGKHPLSILRYTGVESGDLNSRLVRGESPTIMQQSLHKNLHTMYDSAAPLQKTHHVYSSTGHFDPSSAVGEHGVFHTPAHTSASLHPGIAAMHANATSDSAKHDHHIIHFELPAGSQHGLYIGGTSKFPEEREFLLRPNSKWKVTGKTEHQMTPTTKRTIWHVKPHDAKLNELFNHDVEDLTSVSAASTAIRAESHHDRMHAAFKEVGNDFRNINSQHHHHAKTLNEYTDESYPINMVLISGHNGSHDSSFVTKQTDRISRAIQHYSKPLDHEAHVYSGLGHFDPTDHFKREGGKIHLPAFTSTSIDPSIAKGFSQHHFTPGDNKQTHRHVLHFHLPEGFNKGAYVHGASHVGYEKEYLLDRGQSWKLKQHTVVKENQKKTDGTNVEHHVHIWSVVPHEDTLKEMAHSHDPNNPHFNTEKDPLGLDWDAPDSSEHHEAEHNHLAALHHCDHPDHHTHIGTWSESSATITHHLINNLPMHPDFQAVTNHMDHLMSTAKPLEHTHHVYSSFGEVSPGSLIHHKNHFKTATYICASLNPEVAGMHANPGASNAHKETHILHFELPKGYNKCRYIAPASHIEHEHEMVIDKNQTFEHVGHQKIGNRHIWSMRPYQKLTEAYFHDPKMFRDSSYKVRGFNDTSLRTVDLPHARSSKVEHLNATKNEFNVDHSNDHHQKMSAFGPSKEHLWVDPTSPKTHDHAHALKQYTGEMSGRINTALIHGSPNKFDHEKVNALSEAIAHFAKPLDHEAHVYSGIGGFHPGEHFKKNGGVIHMPAFTSTSLNPRQGAVFAREEKEQRTATTAGRPQHITEHHVLHFHLPKGYDKGTYVDNISKCDGEHEYLMDKGQHWKMTGHKVVTRSDHHVLRDEDGSIRTNNIKSKVHIWSVEPHVPSNRDKLRAHSDTLVRKANHTNALEKLKHSDDTI